MNKNLPPLTLTPMETSMKPSSKISHRILVAIFALLALAGLAGCRDTDTNVTPGTQQSQQTFDISYTLPDGWTWYEQKDEVAIWEHASKDGVSPFVKLEPCTFVKGTDADAKKAVQDIFNNDKSQCDARGTDCVAQPNYKEKNIAGTTVYLESMKDNDNMGTVSWGSVFEFARDGYVACFTLGDNADEYGPEMEKVVGTLKVSQ